ncbi:MAG: hypothetical protein MJY71_03895 [Bacteroidaceae bacterium]|nr:hypothetical protein [Bacteroidaceae bacterium]
MKHTSILVSSITAISAMLICSCGMENIDFDNFDGTIAIGGDSLEIPVGSTTKLFIENFASEGGGHLVSYADSTYCIEFQQRFDSKGEFPEFSIEERTIGMEEPVIVPVECTQQPIPGIEPGQTISVGSIDFTVNQGSFIEIAVDDQVTGYINALDSVIFENGAKIACSVNMQQMPNVGTDPIMNLCIEFPERYIFDDNRITDNKLVLNNQKISKGVPFEISPALNVRGLRFENETISKPLIIKDSVGVNVEIKYLDAQVSYETANNLTIYGDVTVTVSDAVLKEIYGLIEYSTDAPQSSEIELTDIPNELRDPQNVFDVSPIIDFEYTSNICIPVKADMNIAPYINDQVLNNNVVDFTMELPAAERQKDSTETVVHLGKTAWEYADINILKDLSPIVRTIPDKFKVEYSMSAIQEGQHYIDCSKPVIANINCNVKVPLAFGKDLCVSYKDTMKIEDMEDKLMEIFQDNRLHLIADIASTMPLDVKLDIAFLDQDGNYADKIQIPQQIILAGDRQKEKITHLDIEISDPQKSVDYLTGVIFNITATAPNGNAAIYTDTYLQAKMSLLVSGGIILSDTDF